MKLLSRLFLVCLASSCPVLARAGAGGPVQSPALKSRLAIESGNKLREKKEFDAALLAYQGAVRLQPRNSDAWFYLGITYVNLDRFEEARASFERSVLNAGDDPAKWTGLCLSNYLLSDFGSAIHTCEEALRLDPKQADAWAWMGLGYAHQQEGIKSLQCLEVAAALGTKNGEAWYMLGIRYARQGQRTKVLEVYRRLQDLDPGEARKFFNIAVSPQTKG
jgi:tetratricopeptide (TPR) repeat protein